MRLGSSARLNKSTRLIVATLSALALCAGALAQDAPGPTDKKVKYSPYPEQNFPNRVFFGDTHLHTSYSTDAGMIGNRLGPEDAYRFARGETVKSSTGLPARLGRPLDFLVVTDHAENLGLAPMIAESNPELLKSEWGRKVHDLVKAGKGFEAYDAWGAAMITRQDPLKGMPIAGHGVGAHHRCSGKIQRAGSLHRVHRLRMVGVAERQQFASQRHLSRRQGQGRSGPAVLAIRQRRRRGSL